jgi:thiol-disulfide isomerase/thioredoxin
MSFFISIIALIAICILLQKSSFLNEKSKKNILMILFIISFILCLYKIYIDFICNKNKLETKQPNTNKPKKEKFIGHIIKKNNINQKKTTIKINKKEHFSDSTSDKELLFFHADWCGHCQHFKPEWEKTKKILDEKNISYKEINSEDPEIKNYNIRGFPTLMMTNKNDTEGEEYMGPREANSVCKFAENAILKDKNKNKTQSNGSNNRNKTVAFFHADWCGHCQQFKPEWEKIKKELEVNNVKYKEINSEDKDTVNAFKIRGFPTLMVVEDGTTNGIEYEGPRKKANFIEFVRKNL